MRPTNPFNQDVKKNKAMIGSSVRTKYRYDDSFSRSTTGPAYHKAQVSKFQPKHKLNDRYAVEDEN
ncbi:hypothetical protein [Nitrosomonas communis]|uniref:hypothetical protein n=1 Tax=Nitrosomonas communis TaxID=44574 RepID=UPI0009425487|nr:hypothetical protein [Nitrosomonas communis]